MTGHSQGAERVPSDETLGLMGRGLHGNPVLTDLSRELVYRRSQVRRILAAVRRLTDCIKDGPDAQDRKMVLTADFADAMIALRAEVAAVESWKP